MKGGGPFVVFEEDMNDSLIFAPASNYMTNTPGLSPAASSDAAQAQALTPEDVTAPSNVGDGSRGYEVFEKRYCSASGDGGHVSFKAQGYTVAQCKAKCDSLKCSCFDHPGSPSGECRCNINQPPSGQPNTTKSANSLNAYVTLMTRPLCCLMILIDLDDWSSLLCVDSD